jgi:hypothetical protein
LEEKDENSRKNCCCVVWNNQPVIYLADWKIFNRNGHGIGDLMKKDKLSPPLSKIKKTKRIKMANASIDSVTLFH